MGRFHLPEHEALRACSVTNRWDVRSWQKTRLQCVAIDPGIKVAGCESRETTNMWVVWKDRTIGISVSVVI